MNHTHKMKAYAEAAIALDHIHSARDKIRYLMDLFGLEYDYDVNRELARIAKGLLVFTMECEDLPDKATCIAVEGLCTDGDHHKQWFLEKVIEALGYDLADIAMETDWEDGVAP